MGVIGIYNKLRFTGQYINRTLQIPNVMHHQENSQWNIQIGPSSVQEPQQLCRLTSIQISYCLFYMSLPNKKTQYNLMLAVKLP